MKILTNSERIIDELKKINIETSEALIEYLPYRYESFNYTSENNLIDKQRVVLLGRLVSNPKNNVYGKINVITFHFVSVEGKFYSCKIFNRPFYMGILDLENQFTLVATIDINKKELNIINIKKGEIPLDERLKPVYHLPSKLSQSIYINLLKRTLEQISLSNVNIIPSYLIRKYRLLNHFEALKKVHFPKNSSDISSGLRTLKFEECLEYCFKNRIIREQNKKLTKSSSGKIDTKLINKFILDLPYKLTKDQIVAIREIVTDIQSKSTMYRLLQGDVGTGKTIVGIISLYANYLRGKQGVLLAPTDSLARQHYLSICQVLNQYGIKTALLIGNLKEKEKDQIKNDISLNQYDIVVGTHAVFSENVSYFNLGLAIIDEQHRFGVNQRNALVGKGDNVDLLLMSATPIPRTLALSIYGDLDVTSLTMYPNNHRHVITKVVDFDSEKILSLINYCLENNRQVFIVCPKINLGEKNQSSEEIYQRLQPIYLDKISLLHGKMSNDEKVEILEKFRKNEIKILVSTTLIELGIDVKNAGGMIIYSANSFGLASLHQLRGRVGRDGEKAYCLLVDHFEEGEDDSRLKFLEKCSDGFLISEEDMRRRGPGDFIGTQQSGFPSFNSLNIVSDFKMFSIARDEVSYIFSNLNDQENKKYYLHCNNKMKEEEKVLLID